jgi:hypothetical protein
MAARYLYSVEAIEFGAPGSATVHFSSKKWKGRQMLKELSVDQAKFVAILAKAARAERDAFLGKVAEKDIDGIQAARGEHNPIAQLGFEQLPPGAPQARPLREAIVTLSPRARAELYALTRIGQGQLAAQKWHRGLTEAEALGDEAATAAVLDDPDLHDHVLKGLYELNL